MTHSPDSLTRTRGQLLVSSVVLALIAGLCLGFELSRVWVASAAFLWDAFDGYVSPRSLDWARDFVVREQKWNRLLPVLHDTGWICAAIALMLVVRAQSASTAFVLPGQSRQSAGDWLKIWVEPKLAFRGIVAALFSLWVVGLGHLLGGDPMTRTPLQRLALGGVRLALASLDQPPVAVHVITCVGILTVLYAVWSPGGWMRPGGFDARSALAVAARGAAVGVAMAIATLPFTALGFEHLRFLQRVAGGTSPEISRIVSYVTVGGAAACALAGTLACLSAGIIGTRRLRALSATLIVGLLLCEAGAYRWLERRFDLNRSDLGAVAKVSQTGSTAARRLAVLTNDQLHCPAARVEFHTTGGLAFDVTAWRNVDAFLKRRRYRTALARAAYVQQFDAACLQLDRARALRACLDNLRLAPSVQASGGQGGAAPQAAQLIAEMMMDLAPTDENRRLVAQLCNEQWFRLDRASRMWGALGEGLMRIGEPDRAETYYERAGMNPFAVELRRRTNQLRDGRVTGRLLVGGKPAAGAQVGLVSTLKWLMLLGTPNAPPNAFSLRAICHGARTDRDGRFVVDQLGAGQYYLVIIFTPEQISPDDEVEVTNQPGVIAIDNDTRIRECGEMRIERADPLPARQLPQLRAERAKQIGQG